MKKLCVVLLLLIPLLLMGCKHEHHWKDANCTTARICTQCKKIQGDPLGHIWEEATCTSAQKCSVCGELQGAPLGHRGGAWEIVDEDLVNAIGNYEQFCTGCGIFLAQKSDVLDRIHDDGYFLLTPEEFMNRFEKVVYKITDLDTISIEYNTFAIYIYDNEEHLASVVFYEDTTELNWNQYKETCVNGIRMTIMRDDTEKYKQLLAACIVTCDPTIEKLDKKEYILGEALAFCKKLYEDAEFRDDVYFSLNESDTRMGLWIFV